jgi:hypothetical protein
MPGRALEEMNRLDMKAGQQQSFEAGVGGMHEFVDDHHSSRGDH